MTGRALGPVDVGAAAVVIGGALIAVQPRHAVSVVQVVLVTIATASALHALASNVPPTGWLSPFRWMSPFSGDAGANADPAGSDGLDSIRSRLAAPRRRIVGAPALPNEVLGMLHGLIVGALDLERGGERALTSAAERLSPISRAILATDPRKRPFWIFMLPPNEREVTETVHRVLDELDGLTGGGPTSAAPHPTEPRSP